MKKGIQGILIIVIVIVVAINFKSASKKISSNYNSIYQTMASVVELPYGFDR